MRITNKTGLPEPLVAALRNDDYTRGAADISATGLIAPARKVALEEMYADRLEEDAADKAAILIGKAVHQFIAAKATGDLSDKKRLMMAVNGWVISGQTDHVDDEMFTVDGGRIIDYKSTKVSEWRFGLREERAQQLNIYAEILRANGYTVTGLAAVLIFKDWSHPEAARKNSDDYPPHDIVEVEVPLWPQAQAQAYILGRVKAHQAARVELPPCSDEERWLRGEAWAVRKLGNKAATKNHPVEADAIAHAAQLNDGKPSVGYVVEHRPGVYNRCEWYCTVGAMGLCSQWNAERGDK